MKLLICWLIENAHGDQGNLASYLRTNPVEEEVKVVDRSKGPAKKKQ